MIKLKYLQLPKRSFTLLLSLGIFSACQRNPKVPESKLNADPSGSQGNYVEVVGHRKERPSPGDHKVIRDGSSDDEFVIRQNAAVNRVNKAATAEQEAITRFTAWIKNAMAQQETDVASPAAFFKNLSNTQLMAYMSTAASAFQKNQIENVDVPDSICLAGQMLLQNKDSTTQIISVSVDTKSVEIADEHSSQNGRSEASKAGVALTFTLGANFEGSSSDTVSTTSKATRTFTENKAVIIIRYRTAAGSIVPTTLPSNLYLSKQQDHLPLKLTLVGSNWSESGIHARELPDPQPAPKIPSDVQPRYSDETIFAFEESGVIHIVPATNKMLDSYNFLQTIFEPQLNSRLVYMKSRLENLKLVFHPIRAKRVEQDAIIAHGVELLNSSGATKEDILRLEADLALHSNEACFDVTLLDAVNTTKQSEGLFVDLGTDYFSHAKVIEGVISISSFEADWNKQLKYLLPLDELIREIDQSGKEDRCQKMSNLRMAVAFKISQTKIDNANSEIAAISTEIIEAIQFQTRLVLRANLKLELTTEAGISARRLQSARTRRRLSEGQNLLIEINGPAQSSWDARVSAAESLNDADRLILRDELARTLDPERARWNTYITANTQQSLIEGHAYLIQLKFTKIRTSLEAINDRPLLERWQNALLDVGFILPAECRIPEHSYGSYCWHISVPNRLDSEALSEFDSMLSDVENLATLFLIELVKT